MLFRSSPTALQSANRLLIVYAVVPCSMLVTWWRLRPEAPATSRMLRWPRALRTAAPICLGVMGGQYEGFIISASHTQQTPNGSALSFQTGSDLLGRQQPRPMILEEHDEHTYHPAGVHHPRNPSAILPAAGACSAASRSACIVSFIVCCCSLMAQI